MSNNNIENNYYGFISEISRFRGITLGSLITAFFLYSFMFFPGIFGIEFDYRIFLMFSAGLMSILTFFLIYYIPKNIMMFTLKCGVILNLHERANNRDYVVSEAKLRWRGLILTFSLFAILTFKIHYRLNLSSELFNELINLALISSASLLLIFSLLPGISRDYSSTDTNNVYSRYSRSRERSLYFTVGLITFLVISRLFPYLISSSELYSFIGFNVFISTVSVFVIPILAFIILNSLLASLYYKDYKKVGLVIFLLAFLAVVTSISAIYFLLIFVRSIYSELNLLIELLYVLKKLLFVILSSIVLYSYLDRRVQGALKAIKSSDAPSEILTSIRKALIRIHQLNSERTITINTLKSITEKYVSELKEAERKLKAQLAQLLDTNILFVNDIVNKIVLYNLIWTIILVVIELFKIDLTSYFLLALSNVLLLSNELTPLAIYSYSFLISLYSLIAIFYSNEIINFLGELARTTRAEELSGGI